MSLSTLPESVRNSALVQVLDEKLQGPQSVAFDYWGEFKRLRDVVSAQVGEMRVLFPEFTPHDEPMHLARLFGIADKMLGRQRYEKMNAPELFLLACGLYAHDWGMAVGSKEIAYLKSGASGEVDQEFTPLDDESQSLQRFARENGLRSTVVGQLPAFNNDQLLTY